MLRRAVHSTNLSAFTRPTRVNCLVGTVFRRTYADAPQKSETPQIEFLRPSYVDILQ